MLQKHRNDKLFYTDTSKSEEGVGIAIISKNFTSIFKLPESCSIYTAEAIAILNTMELIFIQVNFHKNNIILSDSLSTL